MEDEDRTASSALIAVRGFEQPCIPEEKSHDDSSECNWLDSLDGIELIQETMLL